MVELLYGCGLRLQECLNLRVKDIDFGYRQITVRDGKGGKDRITMLPAAAVEPLRDHLSRVKEGSGHVSSHGTERAGAAGRTEGGVLLGRHPAGQGRRVAQTLQRRIHVAGVPQVLKPSPHPPRPLPTQGAFLARRQPC